MKNIESFEIIKKYEHTYPYGLIKFTVLRHPKTNQVIKKCEYNDTITYLELGQIIKESVNTEGVKQPYLRFLVKEIKLIIPNYKVPCGFTGGIYSYPKLTCDQDNLKEIKEIKKVHAIGYHEFIHLFRCEKCFTYWIIEEEYDSHHGTHRKCKKISKKEASNLL